MIKPRTLYGYIAYWSDLSHPCIIDNIAVTRKTHDEFFESKKDMLDTAYELYKNAFETLGLKPKSYHTPDKSDKIVDYNNNPMLTKTEFEKNWPQSIVVESDSAHVNIEFTTIIL